MARYNIYKIKEGRTQALQEYLAQDRKYELAGSFSSNGYDIYTYFSKAEPADIWWLKQYKLYFGGHDQEKNQIFSGAIVARKTNGAIGYILPLGKTHFYIQNYVEISFGLELAEHIANNKQAKMKGQKSFGGKTSKSLFSYNSDANLLFSSGESAEYIKLRAEDKDRWCPGFIHFGTSVQFGGIEVEPANLGELLSEIDKAITEPKKFTLPLMKEVEPSMAAELYRKLAGKILSQENDVTFLDYEVYGVDFIFSQQTHVVLKYGRTESEQLPDLNLADIVSFANKHAINLEELLPKIKVKVLVDGDAKYTTQLTQLIEYYDDDERVFLYRGKWFVFNNSFIKNLHEALDQIKVNKFPMEFSEAESEAWKNSTEEKTKYRERFVNNKIAEVQKLTLLDRKMDHQYDGKKNYPIEIGDIYDKNEERVLVVKIGEPRDFNYAFDQAATLINMITGKLYIAGDGTHYPIKTVEVLLVFQTERQLKTAKDTKSLTFEIKLDQLNKLAQEKGIELKLSYTNIQ